MSKTFELLASSFKTLVEPAMATAGTDDMLPVLCAVQLSYADGYIVAVSTDRFRATLRRVKLPEKQAEKEPQQVTPFKALVTVRDLKRLLAVFGPRRGYDPFITVSVGLGAVSVSDGSTVVSVSEQPGDYPNVVSLFQESLAAKVEDCSPTVGLNAAYLAEIARYAPKYGATVLRGAAKGGKGPAIFQAGEDYLYLVMPRRVYGDMGSGEWQNPTVDAEPWTATFDALAGAK